MPTYEYACTSCGHHLEAVQTFTDPPLTECPACSGPLRKVFGSIGIVLKGSGFYRTDSRASNGKSAGTKSKEKEPASTSGGSDGSGSKEPAGSSSTDAGSSSGASGEKVSSAAGSKSSGSSGGGTSEGSGTKAAAAAAH